MTSSNAGQSGAMGIVNNLNKAIRENPLAAGFLGAGVLWMLFGKVSAPSLGTMSEAVKGAARLVGTAVAAGGHATAAGVGAATSRVAESASAIQDTATDAVATLVPDADALSGAGETIRSGVRSTVDLGKQYGTSVQRTLSENLERQPLLLGALGLVIGAGIASTFPSTAIESELMGEQGSAAREKLKTFADETKEFAQLRAQEVLHVVKDEIQAQGLTPDAAREAFKDVSQKAKGVADAGREAVTNRIS